MKLVTCPLLEAADVEAIEAYYLRRSKSLQCSASEVFGLIRGGGVSSSDALGHLLRVGAVQVFIAKPLTSVSRAIYHEKFGLFIEDGDVLAMTGSGNESQLAWKASFERFETFRSWVTSSERLMARRMHAQFDALVKNETTGLEVLPLIEAYRNGWLEKRMTTSPDETQSVAEVVQPTDSELLVQFPFALFDHQELAVKRWAGAGGRGLLAMATGSGKTVTALAIASRLYDAMNERSLTIVIIAPFIHLVDQWIEVSREVGLSPIRCAEGIRYWQDELSTAVYAVNAGSRKILSVAVTTATLQSPLFQKLIARVRTPMLVIGDEAHNYGSKKVALALPRNAVYRVGLSATPEKWMDFEGSQRIRDYFGPPVYEYSMADALSDEVLVPYVYHPLLVPLEPDEAEKYEEISQKIAKFGISGNSDDLSEGAKALLMKRARVLASARSKLPVLFDLLENHIDDTHMLIYCGDGRSEGDGDELPPKQIDEVLTMLNRLGIVSARYTAETPPESRRLILREFDEGRVQALVAIRCLDEGVDVPSTRTAFILSSSTNPRQFIQRRGRVLRRSPRTGKSKAEIYDFFVVPTGDEEGRISKVLQGVVKGQLDRVLEFSSLALNGPQARRELLSWTDEHELVGLWGQ